MTPIALVTGSTGFIGSHLCRALIEQGFRVRAFRRSSSPLTLLEGLDVEHAVGDITQPETLHQAMRGVEVVFHAAAQLSKARQPKRMHSVTVEGTRNVLQAATQAGARRVVHTSSVAALGVPSEADTARKGRRADSTMQTSDKEHLMDENHTWNWPSHWWPYGYTKHLAEVEVQRAVANGLDVVIVNPAVVIGAGDLSRVSGGWIIHAARGLLLFAPAGGLNIVHIENIVEGHLAALERGRSGHRYILGGENLTHLRFLQVIAEVVGVPSPRIVIPASLLRMLAIPSTALGNKWPLPVSGVTLRKAGYHFYYNTRKAQEELGLGPSRSARDAISEAYLWYCEHGMIKSKDSSSKRG